MSDFANSEELKPIRCLAVDDEPLALIQLKAMINKTPGLELVDACSDAYQAGEVLRLHEVDALFIDINMPGLNGLDFVASLATPPLVVFTTAYSQYAVDSYRVNAVDYLLKPFGLLEFQRSAEKVRRQFQLLQVAQSAQLMDDQALYVKVEHNVQRVELGHIRYIESMREYLRLHLYNGSSLMTLMPISRIAEQLTSKGFIRIHRSFIVNVKYVAEFAKGEVRLDNNLILNIGDSFKDNIRQYLDLKI